MTPATAMEHCNLAEIVEVSARRFPERTAIYEPDGSTLTYAALHSDTNRLAAFLAFRGVRPGDRVAVLLPKTAAAVTAIFGIFKARAVCVPLDIQLPPDRLRTILRTCGIRTVLAGCSLASFFETQPEPVENLIFDGAAPDSLAFAVSWDTAIHHHLPETPQHGRIRDDLAIIYCTSGSTGAPKAAMLTHGNLLTYTQWGSSLLRVSEEDRFVSYTPFGFAFSALDFFVCLQHGASMHLIDQGTSRNPKRVAEFIARRQLTIWCSTPSILRVLVTSGALARYDYSSLRTVVFAGEPFPVAQLRQLMEFWPKAVYYNLWGSTETEGAVYAEIPSPLPPERPEPIPIGWPGWHCRVAVLDENGEPVGMGEEGELHIAGPVVFQGYWNRPEETRAAFRLRDGVRWYSTGDVVRQDPKEGLFYVGRRDRRVKRHGCRIELDDIQTVLHRHEEIEEAAVVSVSTDKDDGVKIGAYLVPKPGRAPGVVGMKMFCARHLPHYMTPDIFVLVPALPRTASHKVDYQALVVRLGTFLAPKEVARRR